MPIDYAKRLFNLSDDELERFMTDWVASKVTVYADHERFSGAGDMGRDVVGYVTERRLDGGWHNFQCKQLQRALGQSKFFIELGKLFFHSANGAFPLPERIFFAAPRGVVRTVRDLIASPCTIAPSLIASWDDHCAGALEDRIHHPLNAATTGLIEAYDFSRVHLLDADKLVRFPEVMPVLVKWFDEDPGDYPRGEVPGEVTAEESPYIAALVAAYAENCSDLISCIADALSHRQHGPHLRDQRTRYFEAAAFSRYYRFNTPPGTVEDFNDQIYHGVIDQSRAIFPDMLAKVDSVLRHASGLAPAGRLGRYARIPVKQGTCHHLINAGRIRWKP